MTTTLDRVHRELDESLRRQLFLIELDAEMANERLDDMVYAFSRAQLRKPRTVAQIEQRKVWQALFSGYAEQYLRESETLKRLLRNDPGAVAEVEPGLITFPVVNSRYRTYDEQKALFDNAGRRVSDFINEPWHFEYGGPARDERTWFEKLRDRFASWNLKRHMRKAGML